MTYVIKHKPTGLFIGSDEDHTKMAAATQYDSRIEAGAHIQYLVNPADEFEVAESVNCSLEQDKGDA